MTIQCNEISQTINELLIAFDNCKIVKSSDLTKLVELVAAVNTCSNGGPNYSTLITENYQPDTNEIITYPINTYHSINIMVLEGTISRTINGETIVFPTGTVLRHEVTTLNQVAYTFTALTGSNIVIEYLIETI